MQLPSFSAEERRWKCLCGAVHVQTGTKIIGWVGVGGALLLAVLALSLAATKDDGWADSLITYSGVQFDMADERQAAGRERLEKHVKNVLVWGLLASALFNGLIAWCTLHGAYGERRGFLLPYLLLIALSIFFGVWRLISLLIRSSATDALVICAFIELLVSIWFFHVVFMCYYYLEAKEQHALLPATVGAVSSVYVADSAMPSAAPPPYIPSSAMQPQPYQQENKCLN